MTVVILDVLEGSAKVTGRDLSRDPLTMTGDFADSSMTVVAVEEPEPDDPAPSSVFGLSPCVLKPSDLELDCAERRGRPAAEGEDFDIRRTSTMTRTLKKRAASGATKKMSISVVHDQTDQNVDTAADVIARTSHRPDVASYAQK